MGLEARRGPRCATLPKRPFPPPSRDQRKAVNLIVCRSNYCNGPLELGTPQQAEFDKEPCSCLAVLLYLLAASRSDISSNPASALHLLQGNRPPLHFPQVPAHQLCPWHIRPASRSSNLRYSHRVPKSTFVDGTAFLRTNNIPRTHCYRHSIAKGQAEGFRCHPAVFVAAAERKSHSRDRARSLMLICLLWPERHRNGNWS